jgi:hypothetical protein
MFQKVLVVHSFRDSGSEARIAAASGAPDLHGLDVRHICIVDRERAPKAVAKVDAEFETPATHGDRDRRIDEAMRVLIKDDFLSALRAEIAAQGTELCLFHSGTIFSAHTGPLLQGTIDLGRDFPEVRWALERQTDWLVQHSTKADRLWGLDQKAAVAQIKHVRRTFATGPEVERLLQAVFG